LNLAQEVNSVICVAFTFQPQEVCARFLFISRLACPASAPATDLEF